MLYHLRGLREDRDISQEEMAQFLHVHQTTYSDYELGKTNIPIAILKQLSDFFGTSIDYLVDHTDILKPYLKRKRPLPED